MAGDPGGEPSDRALVTAYLRRRREKDFTRLYRRHAPPTYRFALRLAAGARQTADDVFQQSWLTIAGRLQTFRWESLLSTWMAGIILNTWRAHTRPGKGLDGSTGDDGAAHLPAAPRTSPEARIDLARGLAGLTPGYRSVLVLHDIEGYTHDEIGRLLDIETGTSKSQLSRARRALRHQLGKGTPS